MNFFLIILFFFVIALFILYLYILYYSIKNDYDNFLEKLYK